MSYNSDKISLSYSPQDFFYLDAGKDMPSESYCTERKNSPYDCTGYTDANYEMCYQQELCQNKELVETVIKKRDTHAESNAKLDDVYSQYMNEYMKTVNLGVAIIIGVIFVFYRH